MFQYTLYVIHMPLFVIDSTKNASQGLNWDHLLYCSLQLMY